ncbi:MAG TPA: hypothetical protein VIK18_13585, partial [Pirellulales bacterium]
MTALGWQLGRRQRAARWQIALALLALAGLLASSGCRQQAPVDAAAKDKLKAAAKPDFEPQKFVTRPN